MNAATDLAVLLANYVKARRPGRFASRARLERHQAAALARFRARVLARSPYYAAMADAPLDEMPVMSKRLMLDAFDRINTGGIEKAEAFEVATAGERSRDFTPMIGDVSVGLSTGTSGQRGLFLASRRERMRWAGMMLGRMLRRSLFARHRIAFLLRANNQLYESVGGKGRIAFRFFDLKRPIEQLFGEIARFEPTTLIAPAQVLKELARLKSTDVPVAEGVRPDQIVSVAETLFDDDRAAIEAAFGGRVEEIYQATEGFLAYTCSAGRVHLNEAFVHVAPEWIDEAEGLFFPLVTDFSRETQPIVRYRLDDVLRLDPRPCPCASPERVLARIEGRADDVLELPGADAGGSVRLLPDFVARAILGARDDATGRGWVEDFRVRQRGHGGLEVALQAADLPAAKAGVADALHALFADHAIAAPALRFVAMGEADFLQKRRRVCRERTVP